MCEQVTDLLDDPQPPQEVPGWAADLGLTGVGQARPTPSDPVLARLLPDGYANPDEAGEFRRLTEASLRARKQSNAETVRDQLERSPVDITDQVQAWLSFLADCRLILGTRLDVTEDTSMLPGLDPEKNLFLYLAYLQQSLVETVMGE